MWIISVQVLIDHFFENTEETNDDNQITDVGGREVTPNIYGICLPWKQSKQQIAIDVPGKFVSKEKPKAAVGEKGKEIFFLSPDVIPDITMKLYSITRDYNN